MKKLQLLFVFATLIIAGCKSQSEKEAIQKAKDIQTAVKENTPDSIPTTQGGFTMTAKINGKDWKATAMMPPDRAGLIFGENNGESISLPYYDKRSFLANTKTKLDGVEMRLNDDVSLWTAKTGEMEITKVNDNWAEGKFFFTASGFQSDKTIEVTDGFFRISLAKK
jgi:hypothetical protein